MSMEMGPGGTPEPAAAPPRRGWWSRNWKWFVPTIIVLPLLICAGCCGGVFFFVVGGLKGSEPYKMALEKVQQSPEVIKQLGEPIEEASFVPTGQINIQNSSGEAQLYFTVKGPKGTADVSTQSRMVNGVWSLNELRVTFQNGETLNLNVGDNSGLEEAPAWTPP